MAEFYRVMLSEIMCEDFQLTRPYAQAGRYQVISVTDSKGGFDHITNPRAGLAEDKRAAIDVAIVRAAMQRPEIFLRWIEGHSQLTDPLTKKKGEANLLREALRIGRYGLTAASAVRERRSDERQQKKERLAVASYYTREVEKPQFSGLHVHEFESGGQQPRDHTYRVFENVLSRLHARKENLDDELYEAEPHARLRMAVQEARSGKCDWFEI